LKYYLIAGERSGDLHGSNLMKQLAAQDKSAEFRFFGGDYMKEVGGEPAVHYRQLAFMGFLEVIKNLGTIRKYLRTCKNDITAFAPDALILIDYAGFNLRIAKWAKSQNLKVIYYISPKLWAWNSKRAYKIKRFVDQMFVIMPFEPEFYKKYDFNNVSYVGNPVVDAIKSFTPDDKFATTYNNLKGSGKLIAVLPGSRKQELAHILPDITAVIRKNTGYHFLVAAVDNLDKQLYAELEQIENVDLIYDNTYNILSIADAALVTSGTATLETALWKVQQVVVYKGGAITMFIAKLLVNVKYISLVNLILDEPCVTELIQDDCTVDNIEKELQLILDKPTDYSRLLAVIGDHNASENAATGIIQFLKLE
jgi:lipid-A-disaccharide synthase